MAQGNVTESSADVRAEMEIASLEIAYALRQGADLMLRCSSSTEAIDEGVADMYEAVATVACDLCFRVSELARRLGVR